MFSDTLLEHFQSPRNVGELEGANAEAEGENPVCGDRLRVWLRIRDGVVEAATWSAEGCAPVIAAASVSSELLRGMTLQQAGALDRQTIADALGGLPARKAHAALLVASTIHKAIQDYQEN